MKTCGWQRFLLSWRSDSGKEWSKSTQKHFQECAECRSWWQEQRGVEARLTEGREGMEVSPGFTRGVMWQIESAAPGFRRSSGLGWRLATAAGLGLICVILLREQEKPVVKARPQPTSVPEFTEVQLLVKQNAEVLKLLPAKVDDPLEKELQRVISDAKNALAFVADSVVPEDFRSRR